MGSARASAAAVCLRGGYVVIKRGSRVDEEFETRDRKWCCQYVRFDRIRESLNRVVTI